MAKLVLLTFILLPVLACSTDSNRQAPQVKTDIPVDLQIEFGEGGGFTGLWQGHTIAADGSITRWTGAAGEKKEDTLGTLSPETLAEIWQNIQNSLSPRTSSGQPGNMTRYIRVRADSAEFTVQWPAGPGTPDSLKSVAALFDRCLKAVSSLEKNNSTRQ